MKAVEQEDVDAARTQLEQEHSQCRSGLTPNLPLLVDSRILQRLGRILQKVHGNTVERTAPVPKCFPMKKTTLGTRMERNVAVMVGNETAERQSEARNELIGISG